MGNLEHRGFAVENEWYWRITENAQTFDVTAAARDFLAPLSRLTKDTVAITDVTTAGDEVRFALAGEPAAIRIAPGSHDRVAINHFVGDLNRVLSPTHHAFALVVPRRYELRGVLLTDEELSALAGNSILLVPSGRSSSARSIATPTI